MTHYELCEKTAKRFLKESEVILYEYQSFVSGEFPDVLTFKGGNTTLYEIKINRSDFLADSKKDCRIKYRPKVGWFRHIKKDKSYLKLESENPELFYIEAPHLGKQRYYVCPKGLIQIEEVPEGWGVYWYSNGRFYKKKESKYFRRDIHTELSLLSHAFRKYYNNSIIPNTSDINIMVNPY